MKRFSVALLGLGLFSSVAASQEMQFPVGPSYAQSGPAAGGGNGGFAAPTPGGFIAGGTVGGVSGIINHTNHGYGYQTNSGMIMSQGGINVGAGVSTGPSGPVGGNVTCGWSF